MIWRGIPLRRVRGEYRGAGHGLLVRVHRPLSGPGWCAELRSAQDKRLLASSRIDSGSAATALERALRRLELRAANINDIFRSIRAGKDGG